MQEGIANRVATANGDQDRAMSARPMLALDADAIARCVKRMAREIVEDRDHNGKLVLVGVIRRGANLAERIAAVINEGGAEGVPVGTLDISSYRDDGRGAPGDPRLLARNVPFQIDGNRVVLVDDVLYTGRTVRAALSAIVDLGRPDSIQLAVLVDRGQHELPIRADYVGRNIEAPAGQRVYVRLNEVDGVDAVVVGGGKP